MDEAVVGCSCKATDRTEKLESVGQATQPTGDSLCATSSAIEPWWLKPSELTRLLNSTPAGTVISDRQLYRHRERGNHKFGTDKRIDFFRYVAWLISQRHGLSRRGTYARVRWQVTAIEVLELLERQSYRCALTGRQLMPETAALDHVTPVSRGGEHRIENAQVLQKAVNRAKGTLTNEEFIALCREVVAHADRCNMPE